MHDSLAAILARSIAQQPQPNRMQPMQLQSFNQSRERTVFCSESHAPSHYLYLKKMTRLFVRVHLQQISLFKT